MSKKSESTAEIISAAVLAFALTVLVAWLVALFGVIPIVATVWGINLPIAAATVMVWFTMCSLPAWKVKR